MGVFRFWWFWHMLWGSLKKHHSQIFRSIEQSVAEIWQFYICVKYRPSILQTRIEIVITLDWLDEMAPNLDHWQISLNCISRFSLFHDLNFQNGGIAVKPEFSGLEIANILVCKLHSGSVWLKKLISVSETTTYVLSDYKKKCIYILFI